MEKHPIYPRMYSIKMLKGLREQFLGEKKGLSSARNFLAYLEAKEQQRNDEIDRIYGIKR